jgi:cyclic pyranopterin phosphate synthase
MVDVGDKPVTQREAEAAGVVYMKPETLAMILSGRAPKGDVLAVSRTAGIMAAKRTAELIPLCHSLPLSAAEVQFFPGDAVLEIRARVRTVARTGVEMEAMTAVSIAALTIYDMCKAVDRGMRIEAVRLTSKSGGRSGTYRAD